METDHQSQVRTAIGRAIDIAGGLTALGAICGVSKRVVWAWRDRGSIPAEHAPRIEQGLAGQVRCEELCPSVDWSYLRRSGQQKARTAA